MRLARVAISSRVKAALKWSAIAHGTLILVLLAFAGVLQWNANALRGPIARMAAAHAGRPIHIDGRFELHQGMIVLGVTLVSSKRHCVQLTRMRWVPSQSGTAELNRPPGEGPGIVSTS